MDSESSVPGLEFISQIANNFSCDFVGINFITDLVLITYQNWG